MIATVSDLTQLQNFAGAQRSILVTDTETGGIFNFKDEVLTPDDLNIITATGLGGGYWERQISVEGRSEFEQISMDITQQSTNDNHTSEADLQRHGDDLYRVFRYELDGDHTGNAGALYMQKSTDFGKTWQTKTLVFDDPATDDRNSTFGIIGNKFVVFMRKYNATTETTVDIGYVTSDDFGATWSAFTSVNSEFNTSGLVPFGSIFTDGVKHYCSFILSGYCEWLESTDGGATWVFSQEVYNNPVISGFTPNEAYFAYLGNSAFVGIIRNAASDVGAFYQIESTDGGSTWSTPTESNLGRFQKTGPHIYYDSVEDVVYSVVCERFVPALGVRADTDPYMVFKLYANRPDEIVGNETNWRIISEQHYHFQKVIQYGYPSMVKVADDKFVVNYTERNYNFISPGKEIANLWQFEINTNLGTNTIAPTVSEGNRVKSYVGLWESRYDVDFAANYEVLNRIQPNDIENWNSEPWATIYGLKSSPVVSGYNFNLTDKFTKFFLASGSTTNAPINGNSYYGLTITNNPIGDRVDIALSRTSSEERGRLYTRYYNNVSGAVGWFKYATTTEVDAKAPLASPALTGTPTAPTAAAGTNTTQVATTAFVQGEIALTVIVNATTVALTSSDLNTTYPSVPVGTRVICKDIIAGGLIYTKVTEAGSSDVWVSTPCTVVV